MPSPSVLSGNRILDDLPRLARERMLERGKLDVLVAETELGRPGRAIRDLFFPVDCVLSVLVEAEPGDQVEAATIGNEGFSSAAPFAGVAELPHPIVVQVPGKAWRVPWQALPADLIGYGAPLYSLAVRYLLFQIQAAHQTAVCNLMHSLEQRVTRWLLAMEHRTSSNTVPLTQEFLARGLGVSRQAMSTMTRRLEKIGAISHTRGKLNILDNRRLASVSCGCHRDLRDFYRRAFR